MKVQRVRLPHAEHVRWIVLDDAFVPIQPICSYLAFLDALDRSPNTIRATAYHLKLFWEYLRDEHLCWTEMDVARLAAFIPWLRRSEPEVISIANRQASRTNATIDQILGAVHSLYVKRDYLWYTRTDDLRKERREYAGDQLGLLSPRTREPDHADLHRTAGSRTKISQYR